MKRKILLSIFSTILTLFIIEGILRLLNLPAELDKNFQRKDLDWTEENVILNSAGYRDDEHDLSRDTETFRIYALGDSYTYGWLVNDYKKTFPKILEENLKKKTNKKIEIINAGSPGFSLGEMVNRFISEGKYYYPDLVILGINDDEANDSKTYRQPADLKLNPLIKNSHIYQFTLGNYFKQISEKVNHEYVLNIYRDPMSEEWKKFSEHILSLQNQASKINAKLAIVLFPHIHPNSPDSPYDYYPYHEKFKSFAAENGIYLFDPLDNFLKFPGKKNLVINPLDPHPTEDMNKIAADYISDNFDIDKYLNSHQEYLPTTHKISIDQVNNKLGNYELIRSVSSGPSDSSGFPWIYFETKNENSIQDFSLKDKKYRQSNFYLDHIQTAKTFTHSGIPGGTIFYHVFSKEEGKLIIPDTIYEYQIVGFTQIFALSKLENGSVVSDYIAPYSIKKEGNNFIINFEPTKKYYIFRVGLTAAIRQTDIDPGGNIENMIETKLLRSTVNEKNSKVEIPIDKKISSWAVFTEEPGKSYPYAFINGKLSKISEVVKQNDKFVLSFPGLLDKGDEIIFPVACEYLLNTDESIDFVVD